MPGFNGATAEPINTNNAESIREKLDVPSNSEMNTAIAQNITVKTGTFTPSSATGTTAFEVRIVQTGKVCEIHIVIQGVSGIAKQDFTVGTINGISKPPQFLRAFCAVGEMAYNVDKIAYLNVTTAGEIHIVSANNWGAADIHLIYTVN